MKGPVRGRGAMAPKSPYAYNAATRAQYGGMSPMAGANPRAAQTRAQFGGKGAITGGQSPVSDPRMMAKALRGYPYGR